MSVRHCAREGCGGTLPAGKGTYCPRCGGTVFLRGQRRGRWVLWGLSLLLIGAIAITALKHSSRRSAALTPQRQALMEARDLASRMTVPIARDDAYADIIHRALSEHDFESACQLAEAMSIPTLKDKSLLEIVDQALKEREPTWATRAAEQMTVPASRDDALKKIKDAALSR